MKSIKIALVIFAFLVLPPFLHAEPATKRIIGGQPADLTNTTVALIQTSSYQCTGTLVSPNLVLTAAHCISDLGPSDYIVGVSGSLHSVSQAWYHSNYDRNGDASAANSQFDLGMLQLSDSVTNITPVRLLVDDPVFPSERALIFGFGSNEISGLLEDGGRIGDVVIQPSPSGVLESSFFYSNSATCHGDSGGPLIQLDTYYPRALLVGVISYGTNL